MLSKISSSYSSQLMSSQGGELGKRLLFVFFILVLYRIGTYIPLPGINSVALLEVAKAQSSGILGMFNMFTGGALGRMSIFALNIMPYITASIIIQLLTVISQDLNNIKKEGDSGYKKINQYTRYLTILLAITQGYGMVVGIEGMNSNSGSIVSNPGMYFRFIAVLSLTGGTIFVVWLGEQISSKGIGNGSSLIIFTGIIAGLPAAVTSLFEMGRTKTISTFVILLIISMVLLLTAFIIFMEKAQRRILVQYPKRQIGRKIYGGDSTHLPLKINTSGVMSPIFASSLLLFPITIVNFMEYNPTSNWQYFISTYLAHGKLLYILLYILLICFFSFFYTSIIFNPEETAENLRKNGAVILGRRPGNNTANYLDYVLTRLTVIGALYMSFVCIVPEILIAEYSIPFYLGGTSLLIVVNVVMDLFVQIQTYLLTSQYQGLMKKNKMIKSAK